MNKGIAKFALLIMLAGVAACGPTLSKTGRNFDYKPNAIGVGSTKIQVVDTYGPPTSQNIAGKYEYYHYGYNKQSMNSGKLALSVIPVVGLATAFTGNDVIPDTVTDTKSMTVVFDMATGVVKDYWYHDNSGNGHDESETLYIRAIKAKAKNDRAGALELYRRSIEANPNNHRALNDIAWLLIDMNIDAKQGVQYAEQAVALWPDSPYNTGTLGVGYLKLGEYRKAVEYLQKAVDLFPIYAPQAIGALQSDKQRLEQAKQLLAQQGG
jgi:tetratricopeptide (TPR) repeat protein